MSVFKYKGFGQNKQKINGLVEAPNEKIAVEILKEKGINILSIQEKAGVINFDIAMSKVAAKDLVIFARQFSVLVTASVSLVQALKMLSEQTKNPKLKAILAEVAEEIDGGARLSDSLAKRPKVFSNFFINVIKSGESSGKLDEVLEYLADELEKDNDLTSKIRGAMIYPAFVLGAMSIIGVLMMIFIVPKLTGVIEESGMELPAATKLLIAISDFLIGGWWLLVIMIVMAFVGIRMIVATPAGRNVIDTVFLKVPIFGPLFQKIYLVRFTRSLQTLLMGGVNLSKGLAITAEIVSNSIYKELILATKKDVEDGNPIAGVFEQSVYIPSMVSQMIAIGEKTGKLDSILGSVSSFYGKEIDNKVNNMMSLMEPIIMVVIGAAVAFMVVAVMMPMYNMAQQY